MNETAELANNLPAIILISVWAFLSTLDTLFMPRETNKPDRTAAKPPDDAAAANGEDTAYAELRELDPAFSAEAF